MTMDGQTVGAKSNFVINGKFLRAPPTGVHRVAAELANAIADLQTERHEALAQQDWSLWIPRDGVARAAELRLPTRTVDFLTGIPWEQITLPLFQQRTTLINLCNIGPVASRNAVTMIHDAQVHLSSHSYSMPFRLWYKIIQPLFARRHRMILTVSQYSREQIASAGICPLEKIFVVHNGGDHILRAPVEKDILSTLNLGSNPFIVALSTTQVHKNISVLLKAFQDPALARVRLVLIGACDRREMEAAGMNVPPNVCFTGRISDGALRALLEEASCLAFPSTTEGFGLPPMEAMTLGCPVIVAPCGALPEICGTAALYADPHSAADWATNMRRIVDSPVLRAQLSEAGLAQARQFTWRAAALTMLRLLARSE